MQQVPGMEDDAQRADLHGEEIPSAHSKSRAAGSPSTAPPSPSRSSAFRWTKSISRVSGAAFVSCYSSGGARKKSRLVQVVRDIVQPLLRNPRSLLSQAPASSGLCPSPKQGVYVCLVEAQGRRLGPPPRAGVLHRSLSIHLLKLASVAHLLFC